MIRLLCVNSIQFKWNIDLTTNIGVAIEDVLVWLLLSGRGGGGGGGSLFLEFPGGLNVSTVN